MTHSAFQDWHCNLGYLTLRGLCANANQSAVVIALHGYLDNANSVIHLADAFPQHHFIAVDLVGHGLSDHRPDGTHYNQLDYVQDLHALVNELAVDKVILLGHSLGGILCGLYAATFPERVQAVVSIDSLGPLTREIESTTEQIREAIRSRATKMVASQPVNASLSEAVKARTSLTDLSEQHCELILSRNIHETDAGSVWRTDNRLRTKSLLSFTPEQARSIMSSIDCPFLLIVASNSFKHLAEMFLQRKAWIAQAHLRMLAGGHHIHLEQPRQTIEEIQQFIETL